MFSLKKKEIVFLLILAALAAFLRFYRLRELMTYLGDEGRDMLIVRDILRGENFPLIGPPTSVGNLFLGPAYYYFITPFVWLFGMDPIGPAVFVALLGVATVGLVYWAGKEFFDQRAGVFASLLYTFSPLAVKFSRSSWNPNPMPFFVLVLFLGLYYWQQSRRSGWLYLAAFTFGIMLQLHYLAIVLVPLLGFIVHRYPESIKDSKTIVVSLLIVLVLLSPLVVFDLKHQFHNWNGFMEIVKGRSGEGFGVYDWLSRARDRARQVTALFFGFQERDWRTNLTVLASLAVLLAGWARYQPVVRTLVFGWAVWGCLGLGLYRQSVYPHYLGFLFPVPALMVGASLAALARRRGLRRLLGWGLLAAMVGFMAKKTWVDLNRPAVLNVEMVKKVVSLIEKESGGQQFNFALLAANNYDSSYRYFFKLWDLPAVYQQKVADQLFVVCEGQKECRPEGNPKWEIALFDAAYQGKISRVGEWPVASLVRVYKFVPQEK